MDYSAITTLISNVGFPIVAYGFLFMYMQKTLKQNSDMLMDVVNKHTDETKTLMSVLDNNTNAINMLADKVGGLQNEINKS